MQTSSLSFVLLFIRFIFYVLQELLSLKVVSFKVVNSQPGNKTMTVQAFCSMNLNLFEGLFRIRAKAKG